MRAAVALAACVLFVVARAGAQDGAAEIPARVLVRPPECAATAPLVDRAMEVMRVELADDGVHELERLAATSDFARPAEEHVAEIRIELAPCEEGSARVDVSIDDVLTRKRVERSLDLSDVPDAVRPRALAIFAVELLRASWAELRMTQLSRPPVRVPSEILAAIEARERAHGERVPRGERGERGERREPREGPWAFEAAGAVRAFVGARTSLFGGELALAWRPARDVPVSLRIDAGVAAGDTLDPIGRISMGLAGGGLFAGLAARLGAVSIDIGPRLGFGGGWATGTPTSTGVSGSSGAAAVVTLGAAVTLRVLLVDSLRAVIGLEVGAPLLSFDALVDGVPVAGVSGPMLALRIGLALG